MIFSGSSTSIDDLSPPEVIFMQDNEEDQDWKFRLIEDKDLYRGFVSDRPHVQFYPMGVPVSTMTTTFYWGEPPNLAKISGAPRPILDEDYLVCAPASEDYPEIIVFHIMTNGRVIRENNDSHYIMRILKKLAGEVYVKMALIKKKNGSETLYAITKAKKIVTQNFLDFTDPDYR